MKIRPLPGCEVLRERLRYCEDTGVLFWRPRPRSAFKSDHEFRRWNTRYANKRAGCRGEYTLVGFPPTMFLAHRIVWTMLFGPIPDGLEVDHINGDKHDDRRCNLRLATHSQNLRNTAAKKNSKTGLKGVSLYKPGTWQAWIRVDGKNKFLGGFKDPQLAHEAYVAASRKHHGKYSPYA